jgi:hypothetical protein
MFQWFRALGLAICGLLAGGRLQGAPLAGSEFTGALEIQSVTVDGRSMALRAGHELRLRPFPESVSFGFGVPTNSSRAPLRIRYKLEGYEESWHEGGGEMYLYIRFFDAAGDQVAQTAYQAKGLSAGWNGTVAGSAFTHRRETLLVPPHAASL